MIFPGRLSPRFQCPLGVLAAVVCLAAALGCAKSSTQKYSDAGANTGGGGPGGGGGNAGAGGAGGAGPPPCPLAGTWQLTAIACGTQDITASWIMLVPNTTVTVTELSAGGCELVLTSQSASCSETVVERVGPNPTNTNWQITSQGITECFPASCRFMVDNTGAPDAGTEDAGTGGAGGAGGGDAGTGDSPCVVGDRAGTRAPDSISLLGDFFTATSPVSSGICLMYRLPPQITRWQRKL